MESALDKMFEDIHRSISKQFSDLYITQEFLKLKDLFLFW